MPWHWFPQWVGDRARAPGRTSAYTRRQMHSKNELANTSQSIPILCIEQYVHNTDGGQRLVRPLIIFMTVPGCCPKSSNTRH